MVDIPSGSGANKGFWAIQLRDKYGKFVEMGGAVMFEFQLEGVQGKSTGVGYFIGNVDLETARIEVRDNKKIPKGIYLVNRKDITALQAILPEEYVEEQTEEALSEAVPSSSNAAPITFYDKEVSSVDSSRGSEALQDILEEALQAGKDSGWEVEYEVDEDTGDISFDPQSERAERLGYIDRDAESFVRGWPSSFEYVTDLNDELKGLLKNEAKIDRSKSRSREAVAGLELVEASPKTEKPLFRGIRTNQETLERYVAGATVDLPFSAFSMYRNEIAQYWDTPRKDIEGGGFPVEYELEMGAKAIPMMPFDMQAIYGEFVTSGRYEIVSVEKSSDPKIPTKVKLRHLATFNPSLSDSTQSEPESSLPPLRDTSLTEAQTRALEDYASGELALDANTYLRTGESYFYPKEEGESESVAKIKDKHLEELKQKIKDLSSAFDGTVLAEDMTLYRSLEDSSFGFDYNLELKDGEVLDLSRLEGTIYTDKGFMSTTKDADFSYSSSPIRLTINAKAGQKAIDLQGAIKFDALQREQEVVFPAGSKFKISKASYNSDDGKYYIEMDYLEGDASDSEPTMYDEFFDGGMIDLRSLRDSGSRVSPYDLDMFSEEHIAALGEYGQAGHKWVNKVLRGGDPISNKEQKMINDLDAAIEENGDVFSAARIFRGDTPSQSSDYYKFLEGLTEGKIVNFPGYFSASNDAQIAFSEFGPGQGGSDDDASNSHLSSTFFWSIDIPENGKAMAMPEGLGYGQGAESEVILPRNTQLKIIGVKKVEQLDDEGNPTGNYNYFIHAEQQPLKGVE